VHILAIGTTEPEARHAKKFATANSSLCRGKGEADLNVQHPQVKIAASAGAEYRLAGVPY